MNLRAELLPQEHGV